MATALTKQREKISLTIEDVASKAGCSGQTVRNWEAGITSPDLGEAQSIAKIYGLELDTFHRLWKRGEAEHRDKAKED